MKKNLSLKIFSSVIIISIPIITEAAGLKDLIDSATAIINNLLVPIAFALCVLYFFWGVAKYIGNTAGSEDAAKEGKRIMIWGVVGLFVVFSLWGIVYFIQDEFRIPGTSSISPISP